jgi:hypothetical protein
MESLRSPEAPVHIPATVWHITPENRTPPTGADSSFPVSIGQADTQAVGPPARTLGR